MRRIRRLLGLPIRTREYRTLARILRQGPDLGVRGITSSSRSDGGGAQLQGQISALAVAAAAGLPFFYNPPREIAHGSGGAWVAGWREFIDFESGIDPVPADARLVPLSERRPLLAGAVIAAPGYYDWCDRHPDLYEPVREALRRRCARLKAAPDAGVMAVHIRRGDAVTEGHLHRLTPLDRIARLIEAARRQRPDLVVHIHSEGAPADFGKLSDLGELHLDGDPLESLAALANAEILVMAKSSFSFVAALLCRGTAVYEPFRHGPLGGWMPADALLAGAPLPAPGRPARGSAE